ncbi:MAG: hypothetical protein NZ928_02700 [Endomicrobia bacterium]|nr:hypothetical protein [Endomicrobiia bacterium]MDW8055912.1 hypothetical protein [Elusimicrobiota bacterium]
MPVYKLLIEYYGKNFFGSQIQRINRSTSVDKGSLTRKDQFRTVQGVLESVLNKLLTSKFKLQLVSRTDTGVHALCNVCKLVCEEVIDDRDEFLKKINYFLPEDLQVVDIVKVRKSFNVFNARQKVYYYLLYNSSYSTPTIFKDYCWHLTQEISFKKLQQVLKIISSQKKFDFVTTKQYVEERKNTRCKIAITVTKFQRFIIFKFVGNKFTHRMIRNIVSLAVEIATGKLGFDEIKRIISEWKYCKLKPAPAKGLMLAKIII